MSQFYQKIFSLKNQGTEKILTVLGKQFRRKNKYKIQQVAFKELNRKLDNISRFLNYTTDITQVPPATGNLKLIQEASTALLNYFNEICQRHGLKYWLVFGTLIGHVRHNGFIPWDDDIDIAMLREDYEKLPAVLDKEFSQNGFKYSKGDIVRLFYKKTPAQVDIFPVDSGYKEETLTGGERERFVQRLNNIKSSIHYDFEKFIPLQLPTCSNEDVEKALARKKELFEGKETLTRGFLFYGIETQTENRCIYTYTDIFPLKESEFKGIHCFVPNNPSYVLFAEYGDFMNFPASWYNHNDINDRLTIDTYKDCQNLIAQYYPKMSK